MKNEKKLALNNFSYFWKRNFLAPKFKKSSYIFSKKKVFLYFRKGSAKPEKQMFLIFQEKYCEASTTARENSCKVSKAARENPRIANTAASYQEN